MNYLIPPIVGLLITLLNLLCPVLVLFALPFIRWDEAATAPRNADGIDVVQGDLPAWLSWLSTPDIRLPGDTCEEAVKAMYLKRGMWVTSWYWLGIRNCLMGLAVWAGKPTTDYIPEQPLGFWRRGDLWRYAVVIGPLKLVLGYQVYKLLDGTFRAVPVCTLKRNQ